MTTICRVSASLLVLALPLACGGGAADSESRAASGATSPGTTATDATATTTNDPCALAPIASWESATGLSGLTHSRDGSNTCDLLDDANARVAGSVSLMSTSLYDGTVARMEGEAVEGIGDDAYWVTMGPGLLYVKQGDRAMSVMVNPNGTQNHRDVAMQLARTALEQP